MIFWQKDERYAGFLHFFPTKYRITKGHYTLDFCNIKDCVILLYRDPTLNLVFFFSFLNCIYMQED